MSRIAKALSRHRRCRTLLAFSLACLLVWLPATHGGANEALPQYLPTHPVALLVYSPQGARKAMLSIEVAESQQQKQRGLMFRPPLTPQTGMLFPYPSPRVLTFWMYQTPAALDIIFYSQSGQILKIHQHTTPMSKTTYSSTTPAQGALELKAGESRRLGLTPGDILQHPRIPAP